MYEYISKRIEHTGCYVIYYTYYHIYTYLVGVIPTYLCIKRREEEEMRKMDRGRKIVRGVLL